MAEIKKNDNKKLKKFLTDFLLGGTSGAIAKTVTAPLERIKLLIQTQDSNPKLRDRPYTGFFNCFVRVCKEEGAVALWRGNWANVVRYFPTQAFNFAFKDAYNKILCPYNVKTDPWKFFMGNLASGGLAGSTSMVFVYPLDFARTRLGTDIGKAAHERQFSGITDCVKKIFKSDGIVGLYRGFGISVAGIFVYRAFYFGGYDAAKIFIFGEKKDQSLFFRYLIAQFITTTSEILSYPLDTIRRRLMMQSGQQTMQYAGTVDCAKKIWTQEGWQAFFKGNFSNMLRSIGSSLVLVLYDELQRNIGLNASKH
jgi:solute carrier family 25 (adenine nucleotide translocator) protein 4/5/6/31